MDISSTNYILSAAIRATVPAVTLRLPIAGIKPSRHLIQWISILEGYANVKWTSWRVRKYKGTPFKVSTLDRRIVFIGRQYLEDIKESTDDELSLIEAANDQQSAEVDSLIDPEIDSNHYHICCTNTSDP
ncbi:hypothetical protein BKA83DRAFT_4499972 [Pisolithus microcarpus]|nr:hypothetical protein BKA83DRAFT_4499972 [Pisolithus microcarpus]